MRCEIYQIKDIGKCVYAFGSWDTAKKNGFSMDDYAKVYECELNHTNEDDELTLERLFSEFNINPPKDYKAHSMSSSDIVKLRDTFYYCDVVGWQKLN